MPITLLEGSEDLWRTSNSTERSLLFLFTCKIHSLLSQDPWKVHQMLEMQDIVTLGPNMAVLDVLLAVLLPLNTTSFPFAVVLKPTKQWLSYFLHKIRPGVSLDSSYQLEFSNIWKLFTRNHVFSKLGFLPVKSFPCSCLLGRRGGHTGSRY